MRLTSHTGGTIRSGNAKSDVLQRAPGCAQKRVFVKQKRNIQRMYAVFSTHATQKFFYFTSFLDHWVERVTIGNSGDAAPVELRADAPPCALSVKPAPRGRKPRGGRYKYGSVLPAAAVEGKSMEIWRFVGPDPHQTRGGDGKDPGEGLGEEDPVQGLRENPGEVVRIKGFAKVGFRGGSIIGKDPWESRIGED